MLAKVRDRLSVGKRETLMFYKGRFVFKKLFGVEVSSTGILSHRS